MLLVGAALCAPGCVYVYQPLVGLQQPVVVNPDAQNLVGVALTVRCFPGDLLSVQEAGSLCSKVGALFEQQGAVVGLTLGAQAPAEPLPADVPTQLTVELRARELSASSDPLRWTACYFSYSLIPAVTEASFAQEVIVRDADGFLLAEASLQGRIVRYVGLGAWVGNTTMNYLVREEEDRVLPETASEHLSDDLYRQLSQLVYNAKVQSELLRPVKAAR